MMLLVSQFLLLILLYQLVLVDNSQLDVTIFDSLSTETHSIGFRILSIDYTCYQVLCPINITAFSGSTAHFIGGMDQRNSFPLFVHRVCECLGWCLAPENLLFILHYRAGRMGTIPIAYNQSVQLLSVLGITINTWTENFTSNTKMVAYLKLMRGRSSSSKLIYHTDLDEFPSRPELLTALKELSTGSCDAIRGVWADRVTTSGFLTDVQLKLSINLSRHTTTRSTLEEQYPMKCKFSQNFMPARTTWKVLVYRSNLRLVSGQHNIWCEFHQEDSLEDLRHFRKRIKLHKGSTDVVTNVHKGLNLSDVEAALMKHTLALRANQSIDNHHRAMMAIEVGKNSIDGKHITSQNSLNHRRLLSSSTGGTAGNGDNRGPWQWRHACLSHVARRFDKQTDAIDILRWIPEYDRPPRYCKSVVTINHYKYVSGLEDYLRQRIAHYKAKNLNWWRQSQAIIDDLEEHQGRLCVDCPQNHCVPADESDSHN